MPGINVDGRMGSVALNGVAMCRGAWCVTTDGLVMLWQSALVRGQDRILPQSPGVKALPRRPTVTPYSLPMLISGEVDPAGVACPANPYVQLEANITYLRTNVADSYGTGRDAANQVAAALTMPSGAVRTGVVHVVRLDLGTQTGVNLLATLEVEVPQGVLV